ncbi:glycine cleavage system aminomethyltransferase GcvT [Holdemania filiformis]|uniref:glycine cleavage system aminomethyltransferase GcvT n=1 Tax=Holdemania filiformis TaxID=61171 RepID=UPI002676FA0E|nr:glycine cleavage system aminomethyltransferase GcvT [Holdemania filiformis]
MTEKTSLYDFHQSHQGKLVEFADTWLPVQYPTGILKEHQAVREQAGLFDVSHMGEFLVEGPEAAAFLDHLLTNKIANLKHGQMRYSCLCYENGGTVDDLIVYRFDDEHFLCVVNASNKQKDWEWFNQNCRHNVQLRNVSSLISQVALQGPKAIEILGKIADLTSLPAKSYWFTDQIAVAGKTCLVSRNGYTGEDGVEIYMRNEDAMAIVGAIMTAGTPLGLIPCGLGARDTLRLEAAMPLYGHELDAETSPLEAGLNFAVKLDKADFIGKQGIQEKGLTKVRIGLELLDRGIAREHYEVRQEGAVIGHITSGTMAPTLGKAIAMAYVDVDHAQDGAEVEVVHGNRSMKAVITPMPFYKRK